MFAKLSVYFSIKLAKLYKEKILNGTQFGFQKHKCSTVAVLHLIEALQENYDNLKISVAVFIDLAKAYNSILNKVFYRERFYGY